MAKICETILAPINQKIQLEVYRQEQQDHVIKVLKKMLMKLTSFLMLLLLCFCSNKQPQDKIKADLIFHAVSIPPFMIKGDDLTELDSLVENAKGDDPYFSDLKEIKSLGLMSTPFITLKEKGYRNENILLYIEWPAYSDYLKLLDTWDCWELQASGRKVEVTAKVKFVKKIKEDLFLYKALEPPQFSVIKGKVGGNTPCL